MWFIWRFSISCNLVSTIRWVKQNENRSRFNKRHGHDRQFSNHYPSYILKTGRTTLPKNLEPQNKILRCLRTMWWICHRSTDVALNLFWYNFNFNNKLCLIISNYVKLWGQKMNFRFLVKCCTPSVSTCHDFGSIFKTLRPESRIWMAPRPVSWFWIDFHDSETRVINLDDTEACVMIGRDGVTRPKPRSKFFAKFSLS